MKKYFSIAVALVMFISLFSISVYAADTRTQQPTLSITEVNGVRTVVTADSTTEYTVIYDMVNDTMQYKERDLKTNIIRSSEAIEVDYSEPVTLRGTTSRDTSSGFKYIVKTGTKTEWELQRPRNDGTSGRYYFKCYENSSNSTKLNSFMSAVNTLSDKETTFKALTASTFLATLGAGFMAGVAVASAGILSPAAITAIVGAVGVAGSAIAAGVAVGNQVNTCMYAIDAVYLATDNMHF